MIEVEDGYRPRAISGAKNRKYPFADMLPGQSFSAPASPSLRQYVYQMQRKLGRRFMVEAETGDMLRVFRLNDDGSFPDE